MKKTAILVFLPLFVFFHKGFAAGQAEPDVNDSISIKELVNLVEAKSNYRVYTNLVQTVKVPVDRNELSVGKLIDHAFKDTGYKVSVYGDMMFILDGISLDTVYRLGVKSEDNEKLPVSDAALSDTSQNETVRTVDMEHVLAISETLPADFAFDGALEKATSENKIYTIGNRYSGDKKSKAVLTGRVTDFKTGEPMAGVNIILKEPYTGCSTDKDGYYTINIPVGRVKLDISGLVVKPSSRQLMVYGDGNLDIEVVEDVKVFDEVTISAERMNKIKNTQIGLETVQAAKIKNIPMVLGEVDLLRAIQTLPGVKTVGEASSGFNVRGGATDQNLILFNNGTIYNPNHLFGFFTAISPEMIKDAELYKSSIPSKYGGRISSVLNINGKEASKEKFTGSAGIGLVTSNVNLEVPIVKDKTSLLLSGRTTYSDWILSVLPDDSGYNDGKANFYDMGFVFSHEINKKNLLNVYGYYSHDQFAFTKNEKYAYDNINASVKWRTFFNDDFMMNFSAGYDRYNYANRDANDESQAFRLSFDVNQVFAKADFSYNLGKHKLDFGVSSILYKVNGGKFDPIGEATQIKADALQEEKALESAVYVGDEWAVTPKLSINAGIRYSMFNAMGPRTYNEYLPGVLPDEETISQTVDIGGNRIFKTYGGPEFRLSASYMIRNNLSVKAGFNTMRQYIHKLSNTVIMSPTDTWKLSDANIKPQKGWQAAGGVYYTLPRKDIEVSAEVYYKRMTDYLDYRSGAQLIMNHHIETDVIGTEGYAYGAEFSLKKPSGKLNGYLSYTYSRTFLRQSDEMIANPVNGGKWYPTTYDKPHDFKLVSNYKFTERYSLSLTLDYRTGRPTTVPAGKYYNPMTNTLQVYYTDRNTYRIPDYFRGDIAFNIEPSHRQTALFHSKISIGLYNFTGRKNVYSIYYITENGKINGYQLSIFGSPIPYVTYNIKF